MDRGARLIAMTSDAVRAAIEKARVIRIETTAADGMVHRTIIWAVVEGGNVYIRSYRGREARWFREAIARPDVTLLLGKAQERLRFHVVRATDAASIAACSAGLSRRYKASYSLGAMLRDEVLDTTLRLDPA